VPKSAAYSRLVQCKKKMRRSADNREERTLGPALQWPLSRTPSRSIRNTNDALVEAAGLENWSLADHPPARRDRRTCAPERVHGTPMSDGSGGLSSCLHGQDRKSCLYVDFYQANCMDFGLLTGASRDHQPRSLLNTTMPREMRRQSIARRERRQATTMLFPFTTVTVTLEGNSFFASSYLLRSPKFTNN
jgi:hypothetical protein